jgi:hypothetical protein
VKVKRPLKMKMKEEEEAPTEVLPQRGERESLSNCQEYHLASMNTHASDNIYSQESHFEK